MNDLTMQIDRESLNRFFGEARFKVYVNYVIANIDAVYASPDSYDVDSTEILLIALELYRWNVKMSATIMEYVAYIEVFVRNSIDLQLRSWLSKQTPVMMDDWIDAQHFMPINRIRRLLNGDGRDHLDEARNAALRKQQLWRSDQSHPRHADRVNRNDIFAQLTFGAWDGMLRQSGKDSELAHVLMNAFPDIESAWSVEERRMKNARLPGNDSDLRIDRLRRELIDRLKSIRNVRNRAGHEENLLYVEFPKVRRDMLFVLGALGPKCIQLALPDTAEPLRHADPRQIIRELTNNTIQKG